MMKMSATNLATHIKGKSEKEREGRSDDGTVSFLLFPTVVVRGRDEGLVLHDEIE